MVSRETYGMILICIAIFPCKTIADVNMCHEDGVKVIRTESCRGGVTPKYTIRSSGPAISKSPRLTYRQPLRSPERLPSSGSNLELTSNHESAVYHQQSRPKAFATFLEPTHGHQGAAYRQRQPSSPQAFIDPIYSNRANDTLRATAYGLGVHANQYGQAVTVAPDFGGVPGEVLQLNQNAFGPSVHMDQYGRPVRERPLGQ